MEMPKLYRMGWILGGNDPHSSDPKMNARYADGTEYWLPARGYELPNFRKRCSLAWRVFTGELDAIDSRH